MGEKENDNPFLLNLLEKANAVLESDPDSKVQFSPERKGFHGDSKDCKDCFANAIKPLTEPNAAGTFLKERLKESDSSSKKNRGWGGVITCMIFLILLLGVVLLFLFNNGCVKITQKLSKSKDHISNVMNCCDSCRCSDAYACLDTCCHIVCCNLVSFSLDKSKLNINDSVCKSGYCDNMNVTVDSDGTVTYFYRRYDKLLIVLAMLLTVGVCTALVFFIVSVRKTIVAHQENTKSESDHRNKLVEKYMDALLDGNRLNVQHCENILEISRQEKLFQMDVHQKEQDFWWKYMFRKLEVKKEFLNSFLDVMKRNYDNTDKGGESDGSDETASKQVSGEKAKTKQTKSQ